MTFDNAGGYPLVLRMACYYMVSEDWLIMYSREKSLVSNLYIH